MKAFRNILVHRYGGINDERAYENMERLEDFDNFREQVINYLD